ncbi:hypothetical protein ABK734_20140 [Enterobacter sp. KE9933]|uniref:hypothetical protein n=1 Tax=Enterobacter sp. KE9933 TaxID=3118153 RepID=UPI003750887B
MMKNQRNKFFQVLKIATRKVFGSAGVVSHETQTRNKVTLVVLHDINIALGHAAQIIMLKERNLSTVVTRKR